LEFIVAGTFLVPGQCFFSSPPFDQKYTAIVMTIFPVIGPERAGKQRQQKGYSKRVS
jgi:hypothetical protein